MKNKISACILAAALALPVAAQELRSTYFMQTSNNRHEMNPALLDSSYVSMPLFMGNLNIIGLIVAILLLAGMFYMLFKPYKESTTLNKRVRVSK